VPPALKIWNDKLGYWTTSGMDVPVIKNLIRNSNFWTDIDEYYDIYNSSHINEPVRTYNQNKQWLTLRSKNYNSRSGGVYQEIQYPIVPNSNYMFSFIGYRESGYNGTAISIRIVSINDKGVSTDIVNINEPLTFNIQTIEVPFTTNNDTTKIIIYLCTQDKSHSSFLVTELSLYNTSVYYPWELCPEDIDKQMNTKLDNSRLSVFDTLMDNGNYKAIYESENQYYIRSEYITPAVAAASDLTALRNTVTQLSTQLSTLQSRYTTLQSNYNSLLNRVAALEAIINPNNPYQ
jgi:hypothetical protein